MLRFAGRIRDHLIDMKPDGSFRLNLDYLDYCTGSTMTNGRFDTLFWRAAATPRRRCHQRHMDVAASIQSVLDEVVLLRLTRSLSAETARRTSALRAALP